MEEFTATYSPEDNKIRLSAASRLDKDLYLRVKTAGFSWAPRQKIFVAPKWTPEREDLAIELAGEIGDEDTSLVDRAEDRAERFEQYGENRAADAERAHAAVEAISGGIPLGQPILIGHHSEKRARRDAEKIKSGMQRAVRMWETSKYWESRAKGAIMAAKYKELPAVRARRIKTLEAEVRSWIASYTRHPDQPDIMQRGYNSKEGDPPEAHAWVGPKGRGGHWVRAASLPAIEKRAERWLAHLNNRLLYERAMLAEGGGLKADAFDINIGGRVSDGHSWYVVTKLNYQRRLLSDDFALFSVSVAGHYSGVLPIERVKDYRPPNEGDAEYVAARNKPLPLANYRAPDCVEMTMEEWKRCTRHSDSYFVTAFNAEGHYAQHGQVGSGVAVYRQRSKSQGIGSRETVYRRIPVFITDAKEVLPPTEARPKLEKPVMPLDDPDKRPMYQRPEPTKFDALKAVLSGKGGGVEVVVAPQLFLTPRALAEKVANMAGPILAGRRILEPQAGTGRLIEAAADNACGHDCCSIVAVEINGSLVRGLQEMRDRTLYANEKNFQIVHGDFLEQTVAELGLFDVILMNPPFVNGADIKHIKHATGFLKPGGVVVAICANGPRQQRELQDLAEHWEDLPAGTFEESGTGVNTALLTIRWRQAEAIQ